MLNLANKITLLRILMAPLVVILLYFEGPVTWHTGGLGFYFCLDHRLGRRLYCPALQYGHQYGQVSGSAGRQGAYLFHTDHVCEAGLGAGLGGHRYCLPRELVVTGLRAIAIDEGIVLAADYLGKVKTVLQILAVVPLTLHYPLWGYDLHMVGLVLLYAAMLLAVGSGFNYCYNFYRRPVPGRPMKHVYEHFAAAS